MAVDGGAPVRLGLGLATVRPGRIGGAETYVRGLIAELANHAEIERLALLANDEVIEAYSREYSSAEFLRIHGMAGRGSGGLRALGLGSAALVPRAALRGADKRLDVIHFPVAVAIPRPRQPWVVTLHDVLHHVHPKFFSPSQRVYRALTYDRSAEAAALVVTVSEASRIQLLHHLELDPDRVVAIHHGIDYRRFSPRKGSADMEIAARFSLPAKFIYYPANLWPHKNHRVLLEAVRRLKLPVSLVLTGRTYGHETELRAAAHRAGVSDRLIHLGHVPSRLVPALYRAASCVVFPSLFEGFGSPPLEAMACGCPAAVAATGSLPEVCGDAASYFAPTNPGEIARVVDAMLTVEDAGGERAAKGRAHAMRFTWEKSTELHLAAYRRAMAAS